MGQKEAKPAKPEKDVLKDLGVDPSLFEDPVIDEKEEKDDEFDFENDPNLTSLGKVDKKFDVRKVTQGINFDEKEPDVEVTEEELNDPKFLGELAALVDDNEDKEFLGEFEQSSDDEDLTPEEIKMLKAEGLPVRTKEEKLRDKAHKQIPQVETILKEYQATAVQLNKGGNKEQAILLLRKANEIKEVITQLQGGKPIDQFPMPASEFQKTLLQVPKPTESPNPPSTNITKPSTTNTTKPSTTNTTKPSTTNTNPSTSNPSTSNPSTTKSSTTNTNPSTSNKEEPKDRAQKQLPQVETILKEYQTTAVQLNKGGNKEQAILLLRKANEIKEVITQLQGGKPIDQFPMSVSEFQKTLSTTSNKANPATAVKPSKPAVGKQTTTKQTTTKQTTTSTKQQKPTTSQAKATTKEAPTLDELSPVENLVSNDVLEKEIETCNNELIKYKTAKKPAPEWLVTRQQQLAIKMQTLTIQVQTEKISMDEYLELLRKKVQEEKKTAVQMKEQGKITHATAALKRAQIMEQEIKLSLE